MTSLDDVTLARAAQAGDVAGLGAARAPPCAPARRRGRDARPRRRRRRRRPGRDPDRRQAYRGAARARRRRRLAGRDRGQRLPRPAAPPAHELPVEEPSSRAARSTASSETSTAARCATGSGPRSSACLSPSASPSCCATSLRPARTRPSPISATCRSAPCAPPERARARLADELLATAARRTTTATPCATTRSPRSCHECVRAQRRPPGYSRACSPRRVVPHGRPGPAPRPRPASPRPGARLRRGRHRPPPPGHPGENVASPKYCSTAPAEQPLHCPPAVTQLHFHHAGRTHRLVSHYARRR